MLEPSNACPNCDAVSVAVGDLLAALAEVELPQAAWKALGELAAAGITAAVAARDARDGVS